MSIDFRSLANPHIRHLTPYQPGKPLEELEQEGILEPIKLASNENPLGASPIVISAIKASMDRLHLYPDGAHLELKRTLGESLGVKPQQITVGNGSENILELIIKAYLAQDANAVISQYAFLTIFLLIRSVGAKATIVPAVNWGHDITNMIKAINGKTRLLFLVNPNNPTGTYTNAQDFHTLMASVPPHVLVVVDEAYAEYITYEDYPCTQRYLNTYPNLIITRTFSKIYGLAGLRIGYAISSASIADILNRVRLPFNVNTIALKAANAALKDQEHIKQSIHITKLGAEQLMAGFKQMHLNFIPSVGNFLTFAVNDASIYQKLLHQGIIVRSLNDYKMPRHLRVTIGTASQNERFLTSLQKVL